jgi:hypothetical protein
VIFNRLSKKDTTSIDKLRYSVSELTKKNWMEKIKFDNKAEISNDLSEIPIYTDENLAGSFVCLSDLRQKVNNKLT